VLFECNRAQGGKQSGEVENRLSCRSLTTVIGKQVNFGLELDMNDTNDLISSQHLPFGIISHSDLFLSKTERHWTS
jgi:hypothetical protein